MKTWVKNVLIFGGVLVAVLGLIAAFGGWLSTFLAVLAVLFFVSLAFIGRTIWDSIRIYAARKNVWWSLWALLRENSQVAITKGDSIIRYVTNATDQAVRDRMNTLIAAGERITLLDPGESVIYVGWKMIYGLKSWAFSEWLEFIKGQTKHAMPVDIQKKTFPQQKLSPKEMDALLMKVSAAKNSGGQIDPAEAEGLLVIPFLLDADNIALGLPVEVHFRLMHPRLNFTDGKYAHDKLLSVLVPMLRKTISRLNFMGTSDGGAKIINPDLKINVQRYLNIYLGLQKTDDAQILLPDEELGIDILDTFGIELIRVLVGDVNETSQEITDAMRRRVLAETKREAEVVEADAQAKVDMRRAEGKKQADITVAEGEKQATILRAEGDLEAGKKLAERDRITLEERIRAFGGDINPGSIAAYLHSRGIEVRGLNMANAGRVYLTDTSGHSSLSPELLSLLEMLKNGPPMTTQDLVETIKGEKNPPAQENPGPEQS